MLQRILRLALRAGGWLLTPIIVVLAATLGATIASLPSASFWPTTALVIAAVGGVLGAGLGLWLWTRLLRQSPELRDVLHVTPEGVPTEEAMTDVLGQDRSSERDGA